MRRLQLPRRRTQRGETLIEAMVSLAVLSVGLLGILQMNGFASQQSGVARKETTAAAVARDLVDAFERLPYAHPALANSGMGLSDADFLNIDNPTGLHDIKAFYGGRPILGGVNAIVGSDLGASDMEIRWRVADAIGVKRIAILIRYQVGSAGQRQLTMWTSKADLATVVGGNRGIIPEI